MINRDDAFKIATEFIQKAGTSVPSANLIINDNFTKEESFGWVFVWNDRRYLETHDVKYALFGNIPIIVLRRTGEVLQLPWTPLKKLDQNIEEFARTYEDKYMNPNK